MDVCNAAPRALGENILGAGDPPRRHGDPLTAPSRCGESSSLPTRSKSRRCDYIRHPAIGPRLTNRAGVTTGSVIRVALVRVWAWLLLTVHAPPSGGARWEPTQATAGDGQPRSCNRYLIFPISGQPPPQRVKLHLDTLALQPYKGRRPPAHSPPTAAARYASAYHTILEPRRCPRMSRLPNGSRRLRAPFPPSRKNARWTTPTGPQCHHR